MHLVLGSERFDLPDRTVIIALGAASGTRLTGADALWTEDIAGLGALRLPVGADAADADAVARLADAGVAVVGIRPGDRAAWAAAGDRGLTVLVDPDDLPDVAGALPAERVLVSARLPVDRAVACATSAGSGPAAWGAAARALVAGVRVVRTPEPGSLRRIATVVERLLAAREAQTP